MLNCLLRSFQHKYLSSSVSKIRIIQNLITTRKLQPHKYLATDSRLKKFSKLACSSESNVVQELHVRIGVQVRNDEKGCIHSQVLSE